MDVSRRSLGRLLAAAAATQAAPAQTPAPQTNSEDRAAVEQRRTHAQQLSQVAVPMPTEPAFRFKA